MIAANRWKITVMVTVFLTSCAVSQKAASNLQLELIGPWQWAYAQGGAAETEVHEIGDSQYRLVFTDSRFVLEIGEGGQFDGEFTIQGEDRAAWTGEVGPLLHLDASVPLLREQDWVVRLEGDTLRLMTLALDSFDHIFFRSR